MSGGEYDYAYRKVEYFLEAFPDEGPNPSLRAEFRKHLRVVAEAMRAIEFNDSGDGAPEEVRTIRQALKRDVIGARHNRMANALGVNLPNSEDCLEVLLEAVLSLKQEVHDLRAESGKGSYGQRS
jgi:hypothetical protein